MNASFDLRNIPHISLHCSVSANGTTLDTSSLRVLGHTKCLWLRLTYPRTIFHSSGRYQGNTYTLDHRQTANDLVMREALETIAQQPAVPVGLFFSSGVAAGSMRCVSCAYACIIIVDRDRSDLGAKDRDDSIIMRSTVKAGRSQGQ